MNREIKFRAWTGNKMWYGVEMWDDFPFIVAPQGEYVNWKLMQYIGFKDKNNKEIYEGDIVKVKSGFAKDCENYKFIGLVKFINGSFVIGAKPIFELIDDNCEFEVIGNIYDKPELTKEAME